MGERNMPQTACHLQRRAGLKNIRTEELVMPLTNYSNLNSTSCVLPGQNSIDGLDGMSADELYPRV